MSEHDAPHAVGLDDDDDGMPPLVDRPPTMTFTFCADLAPIDFSPGADADADATRFELVPDADAPPPHEQHDAARPRASHGKKHDASYIPRPPNAFILFRSSFIRSQQIPDKIEGNHSSLSKIIGIVWKSLPRAERAHWEAQAVQAQAEHRQRYPHWRFRNANASVLGKAEPRRRRRGAGGGTVMRPAEDGGRERRCAKIAGLLAQGVAGAALATAVRDWEVASGVKGGGRASEKASEKVDVKAAGGAAAARSGEEQVSGPRAGGARKGGDADVDLATGKARSASPVRFTVPLTAMFKRSLSAPLVDVAAAAATSPSPHHNDLHHNHKPARDRVTTGPGPFEMLPQPALSPAPSDASAPPAFGWPNASINTQSPPGSPFSVGTADTELCASPVDTPMPPPMVAQGYLSSYSSLYGWAGSGDAGSPLDADVVGPGPFAHGYSYGGAQKDFDFDLEFGSGAGYGYGLGYGLGYGYARDPAVYEGPDGCDYGGRDVGAGPYAFGAAQAPYGYGVPQGVGLARGAAYSFA